VLYHFVHALALLLLAFYGAANRGVWWLLVAGIFIFSGSLYAMALIPQTRDWLGAITPIGGLFFFCSWGWAGFRANKIKSPREERPALCQHEGACFRTLLFDIVPLDV